MSTTATPPVLIVEDSEDDVFLLTRLLQHAGVTAPILAVPDGAEATAFFQRATGSRGGIELPVISFLDVKLPKQSGFEVLEWIRSNEGFARVPVIMLSSSDDPRDVARAARLGAQCYLRKFPSAGVLSEVIEHATIHAQGKAGSAPALFGSDWNLLVRKH